LAGIMTGDEMFVDMHKEVFDTWHPTISETIKTKLSDLVTRRGDAFISPLITLFISSLADFNNRNLVEMLGSSDEIKESMRKTPYRFSDESFESHFASFVDVIIPLVAELEANGVRAYWNENKLPLIKAKCSELDEQLVKYNMEDVLQPFADMNMADCNIYLCAFANPFAIKLCGNTLITDVSNPLDTILANATHEIFHPPYNLDIVNDSVQELTNKPWVKAVYEKQPPSAGFGSEEGFIEENIVEALGIYIAVKLGANIEPYKYFKNHDDGSHVISSHFYKYLCENEKMREQSFEDYFVDFVSSLT
jgi:hypothetical protein